jgi:hypothetical protein
LPVAVEEDVAGGGVGLGEVSVQLEGSSGCRQTALAPGQVLHVGRHAGGFPQIGVGQSEVRGFQGGALEIVGRLSELSAILIIQPSEKVIICLTDYPGR